MQPDVRSWRDLEGIGAPIGRAVAVQSPKRKAAAQGILSCGHTLSSLGLAGTSINAVSAWPGRGSRAGCTARSGQATGLHRGLVHIGMTYPRPPSIQKLESCKVQTTTDTNVWIREVAPAARSESRTYA
jgi:hypothetical protein